MNNNPNPTPKLPLDLGDNLVLRFATAADTDALVEFNSAMHDGGSSVAYIGGLVRDFMSGEHPLLRPGDFTLVENSKTGEIVSSMNLISHIWRFGDVPFKIGSPELVGTVKEYRRRGLVRKQFEVIHALSAARGELMQCIAGIESYYRMFGYEMAMNLGGIRFAYPRDFPKFDAEASPFRLRPATSADLPFIRECHEQGYKRYTYAAPPDDDLWQYLFLAERHPDSDGRRLWQIIETKNGERLGYVMHMPFTGSKGLYISQVELKAGLGFLPIVPALLHGMQKVAQQLPISGYAKEKNDTLRFRLGLDHPLYDAWPQGFYHKHPPYAWYIRVPDLPAFLNHVRPALDRHLADSVAAGFSGELKLNFFRSGLRLRFDDGRVSEIAGWQPDQPEDGDAHFPDLQFLQLLCGRRRAAELAAETADCWVNNNAEVILDALFPPFRGNVWITE